MSTKAWQRLSESTIAQMFEDYIKTIAAKECPYCHKPIEKQDQVGRCVYARPCGHRLYQGIAINEH